MSAHENPSSTKAIATVRDVCRMVGLSPARFYQLVKAGVFPAPMYGLANCKPVHNAVLRQWNGKLYVIAQAWNPGDFAVLEQVVP